MNSAIFRRGTRKGCGCMRGGANSNLNMQQLKLNKWNKKIANMTKRGFPPRQIAAEQKLRNEQKVLVNKLRAAASAQTGILNTIKNKVTNAVQSVTNSATQAQTAVIRANNSSGQQAVLAANNAVAAANVAVNQSKILAALANRANQLAKNIRSMTAPAAGGKRNRRTRRK